MKKKYAFKVFDYDYNYSDDYKHDYENLFATFQEFAEKGYRYHSYLPGRPDPNEGSYESTILIFEKDDENDDF